MNISPRERGIFGLKDRLSVTELNIQNSQKKKHWLPHSWDSPSNS